MAYYLVMVAQEDAGLLIDVMLQVLRQTTQLSGVIKASVKATRTKAAPSSVRVRLEFSLDSCLYDQGKGIDSLK